MNNLRQHRTTDSEENPKPKCCDDPCVESRDGSQVCLNCGMTFGKCYVGNERRAYTTEEVEKRKRTEPRWREFGPRTILPNEKRDSKGHVMNKNRKTLFSRLSKIQKSLVSSIERNFWEAKPKMKKIVLKMNIPEHIHETAWRIYTKVAKKQLTMGRSIEGFVAASLYAAIRVHEFPRLLEEVSEAMMIPRRKVIRSLGMIVKEILPELNLKYKPITAEQLIFKFGTDLGIPINAQKKAVNMLVRSSKNGLRRAGKDPRGFAASALYMAAKPTDHRKTQQEVSDIAKITEVTLRSRSKEIKNKLKKK
ncbi:MAG: transcription initiation factor IIB [Promethearchaeia archaeon]